MCCVVLCESYKKTRPKIGTLEHQKGFLLPCLRGSLLLPGWDYEALLSELPRRLRYSQNPRFTTSLLLPLMKLPGTLSKPINAPSLLFWSQYGSTVYRWAFDWMEPFDEWQSWEPSEMSKASLAKSHCHTNTSSSCLQPPCFRNQEPLQENWDIVTWF